VLGSLRAEDGTELSTMTYLPPKLEDGRRYPALLYVYGGPQTQVVTNAWDGRRGLFFQLMARMGLVVFALDNRGSGGAATPSRRSPTAGSGRSRSPTSSPAPVTSPPCRSWTAAASGSTAAATAGT